MPVVWRSKSAASISDKGKTADVGANEACAEPKRFLPAAGSAAPSIKLFQASQLGHLPIQRALVPPHSVQV
jgi:hypothetical protein